MDDAQLVFLRDASDLSLQQFELNKRAEAADLLKASRANFFAAAEALAEAKAARYLWEHRGELKERPVEGVFLSFPAGSK